MNTDGERYNSITERVIGCAFRVGSRLGCGFLEKCYENALIYEIRKAGLTAEQQVPIKVWYDGIVVGDFYADIVVEGVLLIELKSAKALDTIHAAQCINYLSATGLPLCLLINFWRKVEIKRIAGATLAGQPS